MPAKLEAMRCIQMDNNFLDYIDFERVNSLLEGFNRTTGFVTAIVDLDGNILSRSGWRRICTEYHRLHPETAQKCILSDTVLSRKAREKESYHFYQCLNGLVDVAVPIVIKGEHVANLFSGQFFFEEPDLSFFKEQATLYGFDEESYIAVLKEVPVVSKEEVTVAMDFLLNMTQLISEMSFQRLEQTELTEALKNNEIALRHSEEKYRALFNTFPLGITITDPVGNILENNSRAIELLGLSKTEQEKRSIDGVQWNIIRPDGSPMPAEEFASVRALKEHRLVENVEMGIVKPNAEVTWINVTAAPLCLENCGLVITYNDISSRLKAEREYEMLFNEMLDGFALHEIICDDSGRPVDYRFLDINPAFERMTGLKLHEVQGKTVLDILPETEYYWIETYGKVALTGEPAVFENYSKGLDKYFEVTAFRPAPNQFSCIFADITERKRTQEALHQSLERFRIAQDMSPDGFTILRPIRDADGQVVDFTWVYENPAVARLNGTDREAVVGKRLLELFPGHRDTELFKTYRQVAQSGVSSTIEAGYSGESMQKPIWLRLVVVPMAGDIAILAQDLTERKEAEERLKYQHEHDFLTGLYNRGFLEKELVRLADEQYLPVSLIIADTNGLKLINDSFGHAMGDTVLRTAAELLRANCRSGDIVARYGGDEFVMLLPNTTNAEASLRLNGIESMAKDLQVASIQLRLSYGLQTRNTSRDEFASVFKKAEDMMSRNKLYESSSEKNKTIGLVINSLFAKSHRESQHSKRVSELCEFIAGKMDMSASEVNRMRVAGLMHDIGKISISESILNNPGKLSSEEWEEMKRHPEAGYRILSASSDFIDISPAILEHHERWDGRGYPRGISGESISLHARIITVADAYDAMTSERAYKLPMSSHDAIQEIRNCVGTQFDPQVANVFIEHYQEFVSRE